MYYKPFIIETLIQNIYEQISSPSHSLVVRAEIRLAQLTERGSALVEESGWIEHLYKTLKTFMNKYLAQALFGCTSRDLTKRGSALWQRRVAGLNPIGRPVPL